MNGMSVVSSPGWIGPVHSVRPAADPAQLIVLREGIYRPRNDVHLLRVLAGCAWVSLNGVDHILAPGEQLSVRPAVGGAVVSALGTETLVLEAETGRTR